MTRKTRTKSENLGQWMDVDNDPNKGVVTIKFDAPVTFMQFSPEDARKVAKDLIHNAKIIEGKRTQ
jgi:hypothetical protein